MMSGEPAEEGTPGAGGAAPAERQPQVPKPPSAAELDEISRDQALITDEWGGEGPPGSSPETGPSR
jgi:hypothetical protein